MIKSISYIFLILVLVSCGNEGKKTPKKPENLIVKEKMVDIIYEMSLLSAAKGVNRRLMEQEGIYPDKYVYAKYKIDSTQFAQSNEYYAFDLETYEEIYKSVKDKLEKDKKAYNEIAQLEKIRNDSISKERRKNRDSLKEQRDLNGIKLGDKLPLNGNKIKRMPSRLKNVDSLKKLQNQ